MTAQAIIYMPQSVVVIQQCINPSIFFVCVCGRLDTYICIITSFSTQISNMITHSKIYTCAHTSIHVCVCVCIAGSSVSIGTRLKYCHSSGNQLLSFHCGSLGSIPGQVMCGLWWIKCCWGRFSLSFSKSFTAVRDQ